MAQSFDSNFIVLNQIFDSNLEHIGVGVYDPKRLQADFNFGLNLSLSLSLSLSMPPPAAKSQPASQPRNLGDQSGFRGAVPNLANHVIGPTTTATGPTEGQE